MPGVMYIEIIECAHFLLLAPPGVRGGVLFQNVGENHLLYLRPPSFASNSVQFPSQPQNLV